MTRGILARGSWRRSGGGGGGHPSSSAAGLLGAAARSGEPCTTCVPSASAGQGDAPARSALLMKSANRSREFQHGGWGDQ